MKRKKRLHKLSSDDVLSLSIRVRLIAPVVEGLVQSHVHVGRVQGEAVHGARLSAARGGGVAAVERGGGAHVPDPHAAVARRARHQAVDPVRGQAVHALVIRLLPAPAIRIKVKS